LLKIRIGKMKKLFALLILFIVLLIVCVVEASTNIGGAIPTAKLRLQLEPYEGFVISSSLESYVDVHIIDATKRITTYVEPGTGTQWAIKPVYEVISGITQQQAEIGARNILESNIATISEEEIAHYVHIGDFHIVYTLYETTTSPEKQVFQRGTNTFSGEITSVEAWIAVDTPTADNILIIYNDTSEDSATIKDYYINNRPEFSEVNVLGVSCSNAEQISNADYETYIRYPLIAWFTNNPTKPIRYIVLMYDIPSRTDGNGNYSVQYRVSKALQEVGLRTGVIFDASQEQFAAGKFQGETALVTSINMGSVADCTAYIDKLEAMYLGMETPDILISANNAGYNLNSNYAFDDTDRCYDFSILALRCKNYVLGENADASILYSANAVDVPAPDQTTHITTCADVTGYHTWGANGEQGGSYAVDGLVKFTGDSGWYIIRTVESFNGRRSTTQGHFTQWFSSTAFGSIDNGGNYDCTPIGAISHTEEPYLGGVGLSSYFGMWERGWNFADCAWHCRTTTFFQAVGDPLVKK